MAEAKTENYVVNTAAADAATLNVIPRNPLMEDMTEDDEEEALEETHYYPLPITPTPP